MHNNLEKISLIEPEKLDGERYFESLLEQVHRKGILSDSELERIQYECITLLADKTARYNAGESSSIRVEKAQEIMASNLFTISVRLKACPTPDDALSALQSESIADMYSKGRRQIDIMLASAKAMHSKLVRQLVSTPNVYYNSTVVDGIAGFFKLYKPDFAAQEIHITADYPTFKPMPQLNGIEFIRSYLNCLYYENMFCNKFSADTIHHLLSGYLDGYEEYLINIYEPVLLASLGCAITGNDVLHLDMTKAGATQLQNILTDAPPEDIATIMQEALNKLLTLLACPDGLFLYLQSCLPAIILKIKLAIQKQRLEGVFPIPNYSGDIPTISVSFGDKLGDEEYRRVIDEIRYADLSEEKIALIEKHIHSLADLGDTLLDSELTADEITLVLQKLTLIEVAALSKRHAVALEEDISSFDEQEQTLYSSLKSFMSSLPAPQQEFIKKAIKSIKEE